MIFRIKNLRIYILEISRMLMIMTVMILHIEQKMIAKLSILVHFHYWNYCYIIYIQKINDCVGLKVRLIKKFKSKQSIM